jgi:alpha-mannosidase
VEAVACRGETILALTLLRSVGWLSRDDLASRPVAAGPQFLTPGAQSKGLHSFEFAFTSYSGGFADADIVKQAHAFAFPPVAALTDRHRGALKNKTSLAALDNPHIVVSSVEMSAGKNAFLVRLYNSTASHQQTQLKLGETAASVDEVNFLEKKTAKEPLKLRGGKCNLSFRPAEIKTLRARVNK